MILIGIQLINITLILKGLNKGVIEIKGKDVEDYYNHIQEEQQVADENSPNHFNINEMIDEQTTVLK